MKTATNSRYRADRTPFNQHHQGRFGLQGRVVSGIVRASERRSAPISTERDHEGTFTDPHRVSREIPIARIIRKRLIQRGAEHHVAGITIEAPIVPRIAAIPQPFAAVCSQLFHMSISNPRQYCHHWS